MIYAGIYWLVGFIAWPLIMYKQGKEVTLGDLILLLFTAWLWPIILACWLYANASDVVLIKAKINRSTVEETK